MNSNDLFGNLDIRYLAVEEDKPEDLKFYAFVSLQLISDLAYELYKDPLYSNLRNFGINPVEGEEFGFLTYKEEMHAAFFAKYHFLKRVHDKMKKQIEYVYSPLMETLGKSSISINVNTLDLPAEDDSKHIIHFSLGIKEKTKFSYLKSLDLVNLYKGYKDEENYKKLEEILEKDSSFSISKTNLEKLLKSKGFLEDDIKEGLSSFVDVEEVSYFQKVVPMLGNYNPNEPITFVFQDDLIADNGGLNLPKLLKSYLVLRKTLEVYKSYFNKIESLLKAAANQELDTDMHRLQYFQFVPKFKNKYKFGGLFRDKYGNPMDVVNEIRKYFKLTEDEVEQFVNSRKRTSFDLPELKNEEAPSYIETEKDFNINVE